MAEDQVNENENQEPASATPEVPPAEDQPQTKSVASVVSDQPQDGSVELTENEVAEGKRIWFIPPQDDIDVAVTVKAKTYKQAVSLAKRRVKDRSS